MDFFWYEETCVIFDNIHRTIFFYLMKTLLFMSTFNKILHSLNQGCPNHGLERSGSLNCFCLNKLMNKIFFSQLYSNVLCMDWITLHTSLYRTPRVLWIQSGPKSHQVWQFPVWQLFLNECVHVTLRCVNLIFYNLRITAII